MEFPRSITILIAIAAAASLAAAHSGSEQKSMGADRDWATWHMAEEHHISNFDAGAFFTLHDFDGSGDWTADEVLRTYGLEDESANNISVEKKKDAVKQILKLIDYDNDGRISRVEWNRFNAENGKLPDFGFGPGHHGDDEYEYEIHHFEKYHDEDTKEEDLTHPEDIAHFKKHDKEAEAEEKQMKLDAMAIVLQNIPAKFRRDA